MFWRDPEFWNDLSKIAPYALIFLSAIAGGASSFIKGEKEFNFGSYLFEVASGIVAAYIITLVLKASNISAEIINAVAALTAYYGTKVLSVFYQVFLFKVKKATDSSNNEIK